MGRVEVFISPLNVRKFPCLEVTPVASPVLRDRFLIELDEQSYARSDDEIAARLHTRREIVSLWRKRFFEERLQGLKDQAYPGGRQAFPIRGRPDQSAVM